MAVDTSTKNSTNKVGTSEKKIMKQGYISKCGGDVLSGWKKRYIVLYNNTNTIEYYTDDSKKQLKGTINILLHNLSSNYAPEAAVHSNLNGVQHGFDIECKNRTWKFRCENDKIKQEWIMAVRLSIKQQSIKIIKPSKNYTGHCWSDCSDIYHCGFELYVNYDEWIIVWPLLKLDKEKDNSSDQKNNVKDCDVNDKILYLFDNKKNRDEEKLNKSIKTFHIKSTFDDIYEYFPFGNQDKHKREYYCILNLSPNEQYVFKCKNKTQRELFVDAICEKVYYQDDDIDKIYRYYNDKDVEFKFEYKPIYNHIKYDNKQHLNKWFHVAISIYRYNYKFVLSIERNSSFVICMKELKSMVNLMIKHYFQIKEFEGCELNEYYQASDEMKSIVTKDSMINETNQQLISKHGLVVGCDFSNTPTTPVLHGINCNKENKNVHEKKSDDLKEMDNNDNNNNNNIIFNNECKYGFNCEIYKKVKNNYDYSEENYFHLNYKNHFGFDYSNKPECRYKSDCKAFKRVCRINENPNDFNCNRFDDLCHLAVYRHPPRIKRNDKIMGNYNTLFNFKKKKEKKDNMNQFVSTKKMNDSYNYSYSMNDLIYEVLRNGYEKDLCLSSDDLKNKHYSLLKIVNQKLQSKIHKKYYKNALAGERYYNERALILSLLLYTGCDCNYDLCKSQRNGDYKKWKVFDGFLYNSISTLHLMEDYSSYFNNIIFHLYSGLNKVQLKNESKIDLFYFPTYISTSYDKKVSIEFAQNNGMLMQFDKNIVLEKQFIFCSLEWISKFPHECEVLIARTKGDDDRNRAATINVMDYEMNCLNDKNNNNNHLQIVNVSQFDTQTNQIKMLNQCDIEYWQEIFSIGQKGKEIVLKAYKNVPALSSIDFLNGLNTMYNDNTFQQYCNKFLKNENYQLNQKDFVDIQKQSKLMKYLIQQEDEFCWKYGWIASGRRSNGMWG